MSFFAIDTGTDVHFVEHEGDDPCGVFGGPVERWTAIERLPRAWEVIDWDSGTVAADLDRLADILISRVDRQRAAAGEAVLTAGRSVTLAYDRKGDEAREVAAMEAGDLAAVAPEEAAIRWPFLSAEATARDVAIDIVADEVRAGRAASETFLARIEAKARVAKLAIRAATDEATMRAAASVDWTS